MYKSAVIFALVMISAGCSYMLPYQDFETVSQIMFNVWSSIEFVYDWENPYKTSLNEWQSPKETIERGVGDCEDFTLLFMYYAHEHLGWEPEIVLVLINGNITRGHYIAYYDGIYYDALSGVYGKTLPYEFTEIYKLSYGWAMFYATKGYTQSVKGETVLQR